MCTAERDRQRVRVCVRVELLPEFTRKKATKIPPKETLFKTSKQDQGEKQTNLDIV